MTRISITLLIALFAFSSAYAEAKSPGDYVVSASTLNVRLAANTTGKVAGRLARWQTVEVFEVDDGSFGRCAAVGFHFGYRCPV